ncbi:hypothetical protein BRC90_11425 [Halobacteriales archaeon QS_4_69_34]|nr:MAG: hypothetical protein BRC90_11425 [Halobacteriales archaeon QS_4_69_34]
MNTTPATPAARTTREALRARLARFDRLVEVGIGRRTGVARALAREGCRVTATDVRERETPAGVAFVREDVIDPDPGRYTDADAVYALNLPPELHRPTWNAARTGGATFLFTTLGGDPPTIPAAPETLPGETLFRATGRGRDGTRAGEPNEPERRNDRGERRRDRAERWRDRAERRSGRRRDGHA